jgi:DNA-directed RNA polymerase specialized sigma subunit
MKNSVTEKIEVMSVMGEKKFLTNEEVNNLIVKVKSGDNAAWQELYDNFEAYVHKRSWEKLNKFNFNTEMLMAIEEDLFQAGWLGFIAALKNYKADKAKFITYATHNIDGEIAKELSVQLNTLGITQRPINKKMKMESVETEDEDIRLEIAKALQIEGDEHYVDNAPAGEKYAADRRALQILCILHTLTDEEHNLSKEEINQILRFYRIVKYKNGLPLEANNTITSSMKNLILELDPLEYNADNESEYRILYDGYKENRLKNNMESSGRAKTISAFSYAHLFSNDELDTLIEQVCFSDMISVEEKEKLVKKLVSTASSYYKTPFWDGTNIRFNPKSVHHRLDERNVSKTKELVKNLGVIQDALNKLGQIRFHFNRYNADCEMEHTSDYVHTLSPYHIVVYHDNYYCIGLKKSDNKLDKRIWHYRVDLMSDIEIIKDDKGSIMPIEVSAFEGLPISNAVWNPEKYMSEHLYMAYDEPRWINIKIKNTDYTILHDWFGNHYEKTTIVSDEDGYDVVRVKTSPTMIVHWAMQYAGTVEIMDEEIREKIRDEIGKVGKKYEKS